MVLLGFFQHLLAVNIGSGGLRVKNCDRRKKNCGPKILRQVCQDRFHGYTIAGAAVSLKGEEEG